MARRRTTYKDRIITDPDSLKGKPVAVLNIVEDRHRLAKEQEQVWATVGKVQERNNDKEPEEVLSDVTAEVEVVRQKMLAESLERKTGSIGKGLLDLTKVRGKGPADLSANIDSHFYEE